MEAASASPSDAAPAPRKIFSLVQAAAILEVHRNTLSKWVDQGCPVVARADRDRGVEWQISVADVAGWRLQTAVENAVSGYQDESGQITKDEADRRRAVANAITAEIAADEALRQVVSRHDAESAITAFCQVLKTCLSNAASKVAGRATTITSAPEIETMVHLELNRAFATAKGELELRWGGARGRTDDGDGEDQQAP